MVTGRFRRIWRASALLVVVGDPQDVEVVVVVDQPDTMLVVVGLFGAALLYGDGMITPAISVLAAVEGLELAGMRRTFGMVFQMSALFDSMTVFDNVAFPLREHTDLPEDTIRDLVLMKLQAVGLRGAARLMPNELSGGMARRVAMARAIALDPMLVLYDEPFTGQDPISMGVLLKLIRELNDALGLTSIVVSHDVKETASIADYAYLLSDGKVVDEGMPKGLWNSASAWSKQFLHGEPDGPVAFHYPATGYKEDLFEGGRGG